MKLFKRKNKIGAIQDEPKKKKRILLKVVITAVIAILGAILNVKFPHELGDIIITIINLF